MFGHAEIIAPGILGVGIDGTSSLIPERFVTTEMALSCCAMAAALLNCPSLKARTSPNRNTSLIPAHSKVARVTKRVKFTVRFEQQELKNASV